MAVYSVSRNNGWISVAISQHYGAVSMKADP